MVQDVEQLLPAKRQVDRYGRNRDRLARCVQEDPVRTIPAYDPDMSPPAGNDVPRLYTSMEETRRDGTTEVSGLAKSQPLVRPSETPVGEGFPFAQEWTVPKTRRSTLPYLV